MKKCSLLLLGIVFSSFLLIGCGKKELPKYSFDEVIQVYEKQNEFLNKMLEMEARDTIKLGDVAMNFKFNEKGKIPAKGGLAVNVKSVEDKERNNINLDFGVDVDMSVSTPMSSEVESYKAKLDLSTLLRDTKFFFNLKNLNLDLDNKMIEGMAMAFTQGFKEKWTFIDLSTIPGLKQQLNASVNKEKIRQLFLNNKNIYTTPEAVSHEGKNAYKVSLDQEKLKGLIRELYQGIKEENSDADLSHEEAKFEEFLASIAVKKGEIYFIIEAKGQIDVLIKDLVIAIDEDELVINANHNSKERTATFLLKDFENGEGAGSVLIGLNLLKKKAGKYTIAVDAKEVGGMELGKILGNLGVALSKDKIALDLDFDLFIEGEKLFTMTSTSVTKETKSFDFETPKDAESIEELMKGGLPFMQEPGLPEMEDQD